MEDLLLKNEQNENKSQTGNENKMSYLQPH